MKAGRGNDDKEGFSAYYSYDKEDEPERNGDKEVKPEDNDDKEGEPEGN